MRIEIEMPDYSPQEGLRLRWESGFLIITKIEGGAAIIKANQEGLVSLARHLLTLAQKQVPSGYHLHFDDTNSLEDGSCEIIIEKL